MDNERPSLEIRHFGGICPDKNSMLNRNFITVTGIDLLDF